MCLSTLASVKSHLGISDTGGDALAEVLAEAVGLANTTEDTSLTLFLGGASAAIRRHVGDFLYGAIGAISIANPCIVTSPGHGLETGQVITISGSDCTPTIDGAQTVTVLSADTFSVPVNTIGQGTAGLFCPTYTEFYSGNGSRQLVLKHRPVRSITSVYEDRGGYFGEPATAFAAPTLLVAGTDYVLKRDNASENEASLSGIVLRLNQVWPRPSAQVMGLLTLAASGGTGNVKITYVAGYLRYLSEVMLATNMLVAQLRKSAQDGAPMMSENYNDGITYTYNRLDPAKEACMIGSVSHLLKRFKRWSW